MRLVVTLVAVAAVVMLVAGCDPVTERQYIDEGAGVDLYSAGSVKQAELQDQYIGYICQQAGLGIGAGTCDYAPFTASSWELLLEAGMNDIDQRCDSYLTWLDARRRDKEPALAEIQALTSATHDIMTISGASPKALNIVTTAFGLGSATYTNWNNRLLVSVEQSTVQNVVYKSQKQYRDQIKGYNVISRPYAIYLLRNYLRLCMPMTIESNINTSTTLVSYDLQPRAASMVSQVSPPRITNVNAPLQPYNPRPPVVIPTRIGPFEQRGMSSKDFQTVLGILGCSGSDLGPAGSPARKTLAKFLTDNGLTISDRVTDGVFIDLRDLKAAGKHATCSG